MRLLGLTNTYPPAGRGGYAEITADVMEGLAARGHETSVLACAPATSRSAELRNGVAVSRDLRCVLAAWRRPLRARTAESSDAKALRRALDRGVDAALVWHMRGVTKPPLRLLHRAGVPVLYMLHDRWVLYERPGSVTVPWARAEDVAVRVLREPPIANEGVVCFNSRWLRAEYARLGWRPANSHLVPCGLPHALTALTHQDPGARGVTRLLFAGRIDPSKGLADALAALAGLPEGVTLSVAGIVTDVRYAEGLRSRAAELGIDHRVRWLGELSRDELFTAFAQHDVLVYPSREAESFGLGILEAQAAGLVAVTSALGGPREFLLDGENCLLHSPGDVPGLMRAVHRLLEEPDLAGRLREQGRRTARSMPAEGVVAQVDALLERLTHPSTALDA